jgi:hypothetical protein
MWSVSASDVTGTSPTFSFIEADISTAESSSGIDC